MSENPFLDFLQKNGWLGFFLYILLERGWPFFRDYIWPERVAKQKSDAKKRELEQQSERDRMRVLEERQVSANERQAKAFESLQSLMQEISKAITINNERLSAMITAQGDYSRYTQETIATMRAALIAATKDGK
jgi:hypothetical protein